MFIVKEIWTEMLSNKNTHCEVDKSYDNFFDALWSEQVQGELKVAVLPVISKPLQELGNLNIPVRYGWGGLSFTVCTEHVRHFEIGHLESK